MFADNEPLYIYIDIIFKTNTAASSYDMTEQ